MRAILPSGREGPWKYVGGEVGFLVEEKDEDMIGEDFLRFYGCCGFAKRFNQSNEIEFIG